jgi:hypothetical protein
MKSALCATVTSLSLLTACTLLAAPLSAQTLPKATVTQTMEDGDISAPILISDAPFVLDLTGFKTTDFQSFTLQFNVFNNAEPTSTLQFALSDDSSDPFSGNASFLSNSIGDFKSDWNHPKSISANFKNLPTVLSTNLNSMTHKTQVYVYLLNGFRNQPDQTGFDDDWSLQNGTGISATLILGSAVPEPGVTALFVGGSVGLLSIARRRRRK